MADETRILPRLTGTTATHTAGIYADMTLDGPEIGTLVIVVDRAKNLPNLRTMGKQDPYCAARLGKEAKKTDVDLRGGQTPRWDQELRFIVHESPDYHKIKVSVFCDDKRKTDLIGETWINLDDLLRPGGGQSDLWHPLSVKGRYAGEIRIELTFYDSRPKMDKPKSRKQSGASSLQQEPRSAMLGPRQLAADRSLPLDPAAAGRPYPATSSPSETIPLPQAGLRSYHTPPRQPHIQDSMSLGSQSIEQDYNDNFSEPGGSSRPLSIPETSQSRSPSYNEPPPDFEDSFEEVRRVELHDRALDESNDFLNCTDDPYALQALEEHQAQQDIQHQHQPTPPRHDRVQILSGSPNPRPLPPIELCHAHSAPQLAPHERSAYPDEPDKSAMYDEHSDNRSYGSLPANSRGYESYQGSSWDSSSHSTKDIRQDCFNESYDVSPPPPPIHRNSAPTVPQVTRRAPAVQQANTPMRALHVSTNAKDLQHGFERSASEPPHVQSPASPMHVLRSSYSPGSIPRPQYSVTDYSDQYDAYPNAFKQHLSRWTDPNTRPRDEMAYDPRLENSNGNYGSNSNQTQARPLSYQNAPSHGDQIQRRPLSYHDDPRHAYSEAPLPGRNGQPQPAPQQHYQTPRKSISPRPSPAQSQSSTPYSPDSFNSLNPAHSTLATPDSGNKLEPTPMYTSQTSTPAKSSPHTPPTPSSGLNHSQTPATSLPFRRDRPIFGSDGRIKDPTDHLPPSSYAPEPERKPNRPSTVINIKSRFGPRGARGNHTTLSSPASPISPGAANSPTDRFPRHSLPSNGNAPASSPLAPTHSSLLNTHMNMNRGYNLSSPYPPPVPGKIPLSAYQAQIDEPDHFEMARLSLEDDEGHEHVGPVSVANAGAGAGAGAWSGSPKTGAVPRMGMQPGKVRKSRWGL